MGFYAVTQLSKMAKFCVTGVTGEKMKTFKEIEKMVVEGIQPKEMKPYEINCYYGIRGLYQTWKAGHIDHTSAKLHKQELAKRYAEMCQDYARYCCQQIQYQFDIEMAGSLRGEMVKASTKDEAFALALKIISRMTGEEATEKTIKDKWLNG